MKTYRRWRTTFLGLFSATSAALILTTIVGHGQNTASGQRFAEPSVPAPRDAASNLAMKIMAPFTVASVGDVMVKRTGASLEDPSMAPPAMAQKILARVQALSKPFGTTITIENNVGVIRVARAATTASGLP